MGVSFPKRMRSKETILFLLKRLIPTSVIVLQVRRGVLQVGLGLEGEEEGAIIGVIGADRPQSEEVGVIYDGEGPSIEGEIVQPLVVFL